MWDRGNPAREFNTKVREMEKVKSNWSCRMCGSTHNLELAHIYSFTISKRMKRRGTSMTKWRNDKFVSSYRNALYLCKICHIKIDSKAGLDVFSVNYLYSLKVMETCTALINDGKIKRCKGPGRRCKKHKKVIIGYYEKESCTII